MSHRYLDHLYPVILAGGSGTRLWPLSTESNPKQFLSLAENKSFIAQTWARVEALTKPGQVWVVCGAAHERQVREHLRAVSSKQILCEPMARNTAPAIAWAAFQLAAMDPEAVMVILPADHYIPKSSETIFAEDIQLAAWIAVTRDALVTLGIKPNCAATGFGYLEQGEQFHADDSEVRGCFFSIKAFHEKPSQEIAEQYLKSGRYYWNSGMFVWKVEIFLKALETHQPALFGAFTKLRQHFGKDSFAAELKNTFEQVENISIDYALMEQADQVYMVPARFAWDDVGSLAALAPLITQDAAENSVVGEVFIEDSSGNVVMAKTKPIALVGVKDLIVIDTPQAVLVLPKERAQEVKRMVELLKKQGRKDLL